MNFAIEVPGTATPLNFYELLRTLQTASSSLDNSKRQAAGQQLTAWESNPDYYPTLQSIFLEKSSPLDARFLAIIQLKNGVDRFWRLHSIQNAIPAAAKQVIRERLFQGTIGEGDRQLALHNALVIAKVVRTDFPTAWPTPLNDLVQLLRATKDGDQVELSGALMILLRIVKELGTARLLKSQAMLQSITPELVYVLGEIYHAKTSLWIAFLTNGREDDDENEALLAMDNSLDAIKSLRRLLIVGYEHPHKDKTVQQVWSFSQEQFAQFLNFINCDSRKIARYTDLLGKHLVQFTKLHIEMATSHPASFASLPNSLDLVRAYWELTAKFAEVFNKSDGIRQETSGSGQPKAKVEGPVLERLALKGLLLVRQCVRMVHFPQQTIRYRSKDIIEEQQQAVKFLGAELLKDEVVTQIANILITHFFIFRKADLDAWDEDPQEWEQQEEAEGNAYEWEVRPCAEKLFLDLLTHYKRLLLQPLISYFGTIQNPQADIINREAVYTAIGLAAPLVSEEFDFESMLKTTIATDAQQTGPLARVIRRRIAILLSQWVPVKISNEARPLIYEIFRHFLNPEDECNDIVVRITAARQFKIIFDELGFEGHLFAPYAPDVLMRLIRLLEEAEVDETKLAILESTRSLIQRMETHVSSFGDMVMNAIPGIWESAGDLGYMMKQSVLAIIQAVVMSMKTESARYQPMILPLIAEATREGTELYLYLIEEALDLWSNVLHQSQAPLSPELLSLAETAIGQLSKQNDNAFTYTSILGCYIVLAPEAILEDRYRRPAIAALSNSLSAKNRELVSITIRYTESLIRLSHSLGGTSGLQVVIRDMMETGFLTTIFEGIHDSFEAHQTTGPKKRQPRVSSQNLVDYFVILSRIAVADPAMFVEMLVSLGPLDQVWSWLSTEWFGSFDNIADNNRHKLNLLALTRLLELPQPMQDLVLLKLQEYFSMWTSVMVQIISTEAPTIGNDMLVITDELKPTEWDTPKDIRERSLLATDPVKTVQSLPFVQEKLNELVQRVGGGQAFEENWAVNVDKEVIAGFQALAAAPSGDA
ncbi:ARM repeat-containing protein [Daldinia caldariorum]|uniref:ARM repeat-containing protein n=1 Tax=Daldinia caldariorum TaxID=326644 RepID=UPI002007E53A|nr:ARM repeat-containing protein [Daldinia caldariorum]KAI1465445.1 ARM repeat-containing protein [Daldinia caldariorum]